MIMFENLTKTELYAILTGVFTACLIVSNKDIVSAELFGGNNKYKTFDKNWEDQNKSVRKAIGKMHDRVYNILMKILS